MLYELILLMYSNFSHYSQEFQALLRPCLLPAWFSEPLPDNFLFNFNFNHPTLAQPPNSA